MAVIGEPIVFLDKDGTLIEDLPYNVDPARVRFAPGARDGVRMLAANGWRIVIASNQSAVGRGYATDDDLRALGRHLRAMLAVEGVELAGFYYCPHLPDESGEGCTCRKPATGLLGLASIELDLDLGASWFVGDTWMDVAAGRAAGCRTVLVGPDWRRAKVYPRELRPDASVPDLAAAAMLIGPRPDAAGRHPALGHRGAA